MKDLHRLSVRNISQKICKFLYVTVKIGMLTNGFSVSEHNIDIEDIETSIYTVPVVMR